MCVQATGCPQSARNPFGKCVGRDFRALVLFAGLSPKVSVPGTVTSQGAFRPGSWGSSRVLLAPRLTDLGPAARQQGRSRKA